MAIKYKWLAEQLRKQVYDNMEKGVTLLPTEQELCYQYRVSRQTVRQALSLLQQEGLIVRRQGSGSHITGLSSENNVIGILIADDQDSHYAALLNNLRQALAQKGLSTDVYLTHNRTHMEREILSTLRERPPRGLLVEGVKSALPNPNLNLYRQLRAMGIPIVFLLSYYTALPQIPCIKDDNAAGSALLTQYLLEQGHKTIGGVFRFDNVQGTERYQGYMKAMQGRGITVPDEQVCWYCAQELEQLPTSADYISSLLQTRLQNCSAIICHDDEIAYRLSKIMPVQTIASCENTYANASTLLPFATLRRRPHELGTAAAQAITDRLKGLAVSTRELPLELSAPRTALIPLSPSGIPWGSCPDFS
ncbi:MAG: GntR family transcriptional regulator [bacterium]|nr:GntR family transcriptional regulator [bacterium]MCM1374393.1 GntR family transcriptional regulator [Muribaculum sp.]